MKWRLLLAIGLGACGGAASTSSAGATSTVASNQNAPPPQQESIVQAAPNPGRTGTGRSVEDPIGACGPVDSYEYVATEFECPSGANPLQGDRRAGADARVGNVGENSHGHVVDLYRVPCASGPVEVYVDMYGCPEMDARLRAFQQ